MSNHIVNQAYQSTVSKPAELSVLVSLADQANEKAICWPSVGHICRRTRLSERTVQRALRSLEDDGHISLAGAIGGGVHRQTPNYRIHPQLASATGAPDAPVHDTQLSTTGAPDAPPGCHHDTPGVSESHPGGVTMTPKPSLNHHKESPLNRENRVRARPREESSNLVAQNVDGFAKKPKGEAATHTVEWDGVAFRVPVELKAEWRRAFPSINVDACILSAAVWVTDNPARVRKQQWAQFLLRWIKRTRPDEEPTVADHSDGPWHPPLPEPEPPGWEKAYACLYDREPSNGWAAQCDSVQEDCREWLKRRREEETNEAMLAQTGHAAVAGSSTTGGDRHDGGDRLSIAAAIRRQLRGCEQ